MSFIIILVIIIIIAFSLFLQAAHGELVCEELPSGMCSFAISSAGKRCLLETPVSGDLHVGLQCRTSNVVVDSLMSEYIENNECVNGCGVDRNVVGISSDSLFSPQFIAKLCSPECYNNCPNIVDLHFNLALAEGAFLPEMCEAHKIVGSRRQMAQLLSSGIAPVAAAPLSSKAIANGPSSSTYAALADRPSSSTYALADGPSSSFNFY